MSYIKFFSEISMKDIASVGGKNASLGEMYQNLTPLGVKIPSGFAVTVEGFFYFLQVNKIEDRIKKILAGWDKNNVADLAIRGAKIRDLIVSSEFPKNLEKEIIIAYQRLSVETQHRYVSTKDNNIVAVAVRSSATTEDLPGASFAGQQETYLNIHGEHNLLEAVKKCFSSLFTDRAISYREDKGFSHTRIGLSVGVQKMVRSDLAASGVMFTLDTESGHPNVILINAAWGLGEYVVKGVVNPDEYYVFKPVLTRRTTQKGRFANAEQRRKGASLTQNNADDWQYKPIISKKLGSKQRKLVYSVGDNIFTQDVLVSAEDQKKYALDDEEIIQLAQWGLVIEEYYSQLKYNQSVPIQRKEIEKLEIKKLRSKKLKLLLENHQRENFSKNSNEKFPNLACRQTGFPILPVGRQVSQSCLSADRFPNFQPMDIEWAKDGETDELYIVQARPETIHSTQKVDYLEEYVLEKKSKILCRGASVGSKIGTGIARIIHNIANIDTFKEGEILITEMTDPDWEPIMKKAKAIVTNSGGRTCHSAIVSRELGLPCIVGTKNATQVLKNGEQITVSCAEGEHGFVYEGYLPFKIKRHNLRKISKTRTKIMMNIADPDIAFTYGMIPNDGVGLARLEFIINNWVKTHPLALIALDDLRNQKSKISPVKIFSKNLDGQENQNDKSKFKNNQEMKQILLSTIIEQIEELTYGYNSKAEFYVDKLSQGIGRIAAAFWPREVIVRFSDFKTNEYAHLIGGSAFEPQEENPMLGWRGASRYYDPKFRPAFDLECQAIKRVREQMGLLNISVMIPFCRTIAEGKKVIAILKENGLLSLKQNIKTLKHKNIKTAKQFNNLTIEQFNNLKVYVMCEIPSNVILAEEFAKIFDGFSIGSNDLTQLTLGVDRDSALVSHIYDERNQAIKILVSQVIKAAHKHKRKVGICGQAPSDFPDFAEFLVQAGIDSISLNPDTVLSARVRIAKAEMNIKMQKLKCPPALLPACAEAAGRRKAKRAGNSKFKMEI